MTKKERLEKQLQRLAEMKEWENRLHGLGYSNIAGVDEAGRGPLAGPVVAAAVVLPEDFDIPGIDDSKKLSEKKRDQMYAVIEEKALAYGIGVADHRTIDEINILQATKKAMKQALEQLEEKLREKATENTGREIDYVLIDAVRLDDIDIPQEAVIKGDAKILSIAAASIMAKVTRDRIMTGYSAEYPGYGFEKNKGYGTKAHYQAIEENGICDIHRRTFLKKLL